MSSAAAPFGARPADTTDHAAPRIDGVASADPDISVTPAVQILEGDFLAVLPTLHEASFDAVVRDPPYLLSFRGEGWDTAPSAPSSTSAFGLSDGAHRAPGALLGSTRNPLPPLPQAQARLQWPHLRTSALRRTGPPHRRHAALRGLV